MRQSETQPGALALSVRVPKTFHPLGITHYIITRVDTGYQIKVLNLNYFSIIWVKTIFYHLVTTILSQFDWNYFLLKMWFYNYFLKKSENLFNVTMQQKLFSFSWVYWNEIDFRVDKCRNCISTSFLQQQSSSCSATQCCVTDSLDTQNCQGWDISLCKL